MIASEGGAAGISTGLYFAWNRTPIASSTIKAMKDFVQIVRRV
jgi:hypothetical protein